LGARKLLPLSSLEPAPLTSAAEPLALATALAAAAQRLVEAAGSAKWTATAFRALDYDANGSIEADDFDLKARRQV